MKTSVRIAAMLGSMYREAVRDWWAPVTLVVLTTPVIAFMGDLTGLWLFLLIGAVLSLIFGLLHLWGWLKTHKDIIPE
jgi:hypothetical protein